MGKFQLFGCLVWFKNLRATVESRERSCPILSRLIPCTDFYTRVLLKIKDCPSVPHQFFDMKTNEFNLIFCLSQLQMLYVMFWPSLKFKRDWQTCLCGSRHAAKLLSLLFLPFFFKTHTTRGNNCFAISELSSEIAQ